MSVTVESFKRKPYSTSTLLGLFMVRMVFSSMMLPLKVEGVDGPVGFLVGPENDAFGGVIGIHPNGRIVGVVDGGLRNYIGCYRRQFAAVAAGLEQE